MQYYLSRILKKIQRFTLRVEGKSYLTDKQWVVIDEEINQKRIYIFRNNGELLISNNGNVLKARYEVLDFGNILIEGASKSFLYNQGFIDSEILILCKDGTNDFLTLVSSEIFHKGVQNFLELETYLSLKYLVGKSNREENEKKKLRNFEGKSENITAFELIDGEVIYVDQNIYQIRKGLRVFNKHNQQLQDGKYVLKKNNSFEVKDGIIKTVYYLNFYAIKDKGEIVIEQKDVNAPQKGDKVYKKDWSAALDGEYKISWMVKIYVQKGEVVKRKLLGI